MKPNPLPLTMRLIVPVIVAMPPPQRAGLVARALRRCPALPLSLFAPLWRGCAGLRFCRRADRRKQRPCALAAKHLALAVFLESRAIAVSSRHGCLAPGGPSAGGLRRR